jgi:ABC-2 type transport system permease protein
LPIIILIQYIFILGVSLVVSAITVYFTDLQHIISVGLNMLFYLTPIVYSIDFIPTNYLVFFKLNPMYHIINVYRDVLYYQRIPDLLSFGMLLLVSIAFFIISYFIFAKLEKRFAEEL